MGDVGLRSLNLLGCQFCARTDAMAQSGTEHEFKCGIPLPGGRSSANLRCEDGACRSRSRKLSLSERIENSSQKSVSVRGGGSSISLDVFTMFSLVPQSPHQGANMSVVSAVHLSSHTSSLASVTPTVLAMDGRWYRKITKKKTDLRLQAARNGGVYINMKVYTYTNEIMMIWNT